MEILCENVLRVSGYHDDIVRFDERFRKGRKITERNYHFDHLYPTPHLNSDEALKWRKENWSVEDSFFTDSFSKDAILNSDMETYYYFDTLSEFADVVYRTSELFEDSIVEKLIDDRL